MKIEKERVREIPFRDGVVQKIQIAYLTDDSGNRIYRYTRSLGFVRARFRITLQYCTDDQHIPYIFDVVRPSPETPLDIRAESDTSKEVWQDTLNPKKQELLNALQIIYEFDIELKSGA